MTVKEIFKYIMLNDNVEIIDQKTHFTCWSGQGKNIPLRYCDSEVNHIYSGTDDNGDSDIVISINV